MVHVCHNAFVIIHLQVIYNYDFICPLGSLDLFAHVAMIVRVVGITNPLPIFAALTMIEKKGWRRRLGGLKREKHRERGWWRERGGGKRKRSRGELERQM